MTSNFVYWIAIFHIYHEATSCPDYNHLYTPKYLIRQFPFLASIQYDKIHIGTGTILSANFILTTKKYLDGLSDDKITVIVGTSSIDEEDYPKYYTILKTLAHPEFERLRYSFDVAIIKLNYPLSLSERVHPIKYIWDETDVPDSPNYITVGWGTEQNRMEKHDYTRILHRKSVCVLHALNEECHESYPFLFEKESMFCGKVIVRVKDVDGFCLGEWGSPLILYNNITNEANLIGMASYQDDHFRCQRKPAIFTSVTKVIDFIMDNTNLFHLNKRVIITENLNYGLSSGEEDRLFLKPRKRSKSFRSKSSMDEK